MEVTFPVRLPQPGEVWSAPVNAVLCGPIFSGPQKELLLILSVGPDERTIIYINETGQKITSIWAYSTRLLEDLKRWERIL